MSDYIITIEQIKDLVMQSSAEAIDAYRLGAVKWNWQYPLLPKIVRCMDCKHFEYCQFHRHSENKPNGFCAWGERIEQ